MPGSITGRGAAGWPGRVRLPGEQVNGVLHRLQRAGSLVAEPVVAGHGVGVQGAHPLFGLAQRRGGLRVGVGVRGGGAPDMTRLDQVGLGQPLCVEGGRPPCPGGLPQCLLLFPGRLELLLGAGGLLGGADRLAARGDLVGGAGHRDELRRFLGGAAERLPNRVAVVRGRIDRHVCLLCVQ